jgi:hypothetical protein
MKKFITYEKVAQADTNGDIWMSEELTSELLTDCNNSNMDTTQLKTILSVANKALSEGLDRQALSLFEKVLRQSAFRTKSEQEFLPLAEDALRGLSILSTREEEYIWESSSQLYGDFRNILYNL